MRRGSFWILGFASKVEDGVAHTLVVDAGVPRGGSFPRIKLPPWQSLGRWRKRKRDKRAAAERGKKRGEARASRRRVAGGFKEVEKMGSWAGEKERRRGDGPAGG